MDSEHVAGIIEHMDFRAPPDPQHEEDRDHVVVLRGVSWNQYEALLRAREKNTPKLAYLDGVLELVTKSIRHELGKTLIARLLEAYAEEAVIELIGAGETTFRKKAKRAGLEPDECYFVDKIRKAPHIALEVVLASGGVDKLEIYRRLEVGEVWFWIDGRFWLYTLVAGKYQQIRKSRVLPDFDFEEIAQIVLTSADEKQTSTVRAYRRALQRRL